jgi:hypothetical protein
LALVRWLTAKGFSDRPGSDRGLAGRPLQSRMKIDQLRRLKKLGGDKSEALERQAEGTHPTAKSRWGHHLSSVSRLTAP